MIDRVSWVPLVGWMIVAGACAAPEGNDAGDEADDETTVATPGSTSESAGPPPPGTCAEQETQEQCMAVGEWDLFPHLEDGPVGSCGWTPTYRVVDAGTCQVESIGGLCHDPSDDDGCEGLLGFPCSDGTPVGYVTDNEGTIRIGRGNADCYTGPLIPCPYDIDQDGNPVLAEDAPAECACGC